MGVPVTKTIVRVFPCPLTSVFLTLLSFDLNCMFYHPHRLFVNTWEANGEKVLEQLTIISKRASVCTSDPCNVQKVKKDNIKKNVKLSKFKCSNGENGKWKTIQRREQLWAQVTRAMFKMFK